MITPSSVGILHVDWNILKIVTNQIGVNLTSLGVFTWEVEPKVEKSTRQSMRSMFQKNVFVCCEWNSTCHLMIYFPQNNMARANTHVFRIIKIGDGQHINSWDMMRHVCSIYKHELCCRRPLGGDYIPLPRHGTNKSKSLLLMKYWRFD